MNMLELPTDREVAVDERDAVYLVYDDASTEIGVLWDKLVYLSSEA